MDFLESLGTKPLRFLDLDVERWRKLHRQAQKYLESSGLKEQSTQLYQWQTAAASRVFNSLIFPALKRRTREGSEGSSTLASMSSMCKGLSLNLESCPSRFAWATLCQDESEDFFQQSGRSQELALAGRARLLFTRSVHLLYSSSEPSEPGTASSLGTRAGSWFTHSPTVVEETKLAFRPGNTS